jgi:hypothetical protein
VSGGVIGIRGESSSNELPDFFVACNDEATGSDGSRKGLSPARGLLAPACERIRFPCGGVTNALVVFISASLASDNEEDEDDSSPAAANSVFFGVTGSSPAKQLVMSVDETGCGEMSRPLDRGALSPRDCAKLGRTKVESGG